MERVVKTKYHQAHTVVVEDGEDTIFEEYDERVEHEYLPGNVIVIKDEAEGLVGRMVYEH